MNVKDVMTLHVLSVTPDELVFVAARLMLQKKISGLPVVDGHGNLVGIVSEGDFLRRAETGTPRAVRHQFSPSYFHDLYSLARKSRQRGLCPQAAA